MWDWKLLYEKIKQNPWWAVIMYVSLAIIAMFAVKIFGVFLLGLLSLLTTSSALSVALFAIGYVMYKGIRALYKESTHDKK